MKTNPNRNQWSPSARQWLKKQIESLMAQCWGVRDIHIILSTGLRPDGRTHEKVINPKTRKPYTLPTIWCIIQEVKAEWTESALALITEVKGEIAAHNREGEAAAWRKGDLAEIRAFLQQRGELYGAFAPKKIAPTDPTGQKAYEGLTDEERLRRILALVKEADDDNPRETEDD